MSQPQVFVSHNHTDNDYCREFVAALRKGLGSDEAVWYDEHNLGWGKIRREIEQELAHRQHFIAVLSPTAVASDWVNDEIDAAIDLLRTGSMQTIQFVIALKCEMPLLLRNYKRVVAPDGQPYPAADAARRALAVIQPTLTPLTPQPTMPQADTPTYMQLNEQLFQQYTDYRSQEQMVTLPVPADSFTQRLADLGFTAQSDKGVGYILPPLCSIPTGPFLMGSDPKQDKEAHGDEQPQHTVTLPAYEIGRFPVTVAEYASFVHVGQSEPQNWQSQLCKLSHPVVYVTWHDTVAYAAWLSERTGERWRLPTEAEWEKAARGTDGRLYPWSGSFDKARCNTREAGKSGTTPVGMYPTGTSPYGTQDMAGNVWEWTSSLQSPYPYTTSGKREDLNSTGNRVLRGGSWNSVAPEARAAYRIISIPVVSPRTFGFRLVRVVQGHMP